MLEIANQTEMSLEISWWIFSRSRSLRFDVRSPSPPPPSVRIFNGWKEVGSYEITALVDVFFATEDFVSFLRRRKRGWKPNDSGWGCWFVVVVLMDVFAINFWEVLWNVPSRLMDPLDSSKLGQRFPAEITQQYRFSAWESWYYMVFFDSMVFLDQESMLTPCETAVTGELLRHGCTIGSWWVHQSWKIGDL